MDFHLLAPSLFYITRPLPSDVHTHTHTHTHTLLFNICHLDSGCLLVALLGEAVSITKAPSPEALFDTEFGMYKRIWRLKSSVCICEDPVY